MKQMKKKIATVVLVTILAVGSGVGVSILSAPKPKATGCATSHAGGEVKEEKRDKSSGCGPKEKKDACHTVKNTSDCGSKDEVNTINGEEKHVECPSKSKKEQCDSEKNHSRTDSKTTSDVKDTTPVATVNGVAIKSWVFNNALQDKRESGDTSSTLKEDILDNLITVELLYQEAKKSGISLSKGAGTIRADAIRRAQKNPSNFDQILAEHGLSAEEYQHEWYRQATINLYIEQDIEATVEVKEKTLKKLYKKLAKSNDKEFTRSFEESRSILRELYVKEKTRSLLDKKIAVLKNSSDIVIL